MISGLSHISIVVRDLNAARVRLKELYDLALGDPFVNQEQGVRMAYIDLGNARIELMEPLRPDSPVGKFLERNPRGGLHHVCLAVDDVDALSRSLAEKGVSVLGRGAERNVHGDRIAFVHPNDFLGALLELEEHKNEN